MKKLLALLMVALMAISLAACVPTPGDINDLVNDALSDLESDVQNDIDTDLDLNIGTEDTDSDVEVDDNADSNTDETVSVNFNANMAEQVVYDENDIKVTATEITYEEYYGPQISFLVENNSKKDVSVSTQNVCVNNYVFSAYMYADVNAGKKAYSELSLYESDLAAYGITELGTVELQLHIYELETYDTIDDSDVIKLVINEGVTSTPAPKGEKIYSGNGVTVYAEECTKEDDDYYNYVTRFFMINETKKNVTLRCEDVSVNGFMVDPYCSISIPAGKMGYTDLYFYQSDLESNKIKEIEEVEFYFDAYDSTTYDDLFESDTITIEVD